MANILVYIELAGGRPAGASLEALGEGRRIASFLGATLYAVLPVAAPPAYQDGDAIEILSGHGADKVILADAGAGEAPLLWATHGAAVAEAAARVPPLLVLFAATAGGRDVAPRLAARLGAAFVAEPSIQHGSRGDLVLSRRVHAGRFRRRLAAEEVERPIVVTTTPGAYNLARGDDEAEVMVVTPPDAKPSIHELERSPDPGAGLDEARVVVTAGAGVGPEALALCAELATRLGGELAFTRSAVAAGLGPEARAVGLGARRVAPRLYVACGASGSPEHMLGIAPDTIIIAINRDPAADIFRSAAYGLVGDAADVMPALLAALAPPVAP